MFTYAGGNPNGSTLNIAGISKTGRVVAHAAPEHATEALTGPSDDGLGLFYSAIDSIPRHRLSHDRHQCDGRGSQ